MIRFPIRLVMLITLAVLCFGAWEVVADAEELVISDRTTSRILTFDTVTSAVTQLVGSDSNLFAPAALAQDNSGNLFVASQGTNKVLRYNLTSGVPNGLSVGDSTFIDLSSSSLGLDSGGPSGLLYDAASNRLFVSTLASSTDQFGSTKVYVFNANSGALLSTINGGPAGGRAGMALVGGDLYVSNFNVGGVDPSAGANGAVLKFDGPNFTTEHTILQGAGLNPSVPFIAGLDGMATDGANLYVTDLFGQAVLKVGTDGSLLGAFGSQNPPTAYPAGVTVDSDGTLLVSTLGNNNPNDPIYQSSIFPGSIQRFSATGDYLETLNFTGDAENQQAGAGIQPTAVLVVSVPEPTTLCLAAFGGILLMAAAKRRMGLAVKSTEIRLLHQTV